MTCTGRPKGPTLRKERWAMPRCMSRMLPGKPRNSSNAKALSARTSLRADPPISELPPPPVLINSVPVIRSTSPRVASHAGRSPGTKLRGRPDGTLQLETQDLRPHARLRGRCRSDVALARRQRWDSDPPPLAPLGRNRRVPTFAKPGAAQRPRRPLCGEQEPPFCHVFFIAGRRESLRKPSAPLSPLAPATAPVAEPCRARATGLE